MLGSGTRLSRKRTSEREDPLSAARKYLARGWSVVPIRPGGKWPLVSWMPYQHRRPHEQEVREWFRQWPEAGVGIVTGAVSDLVVLDIDVRHGGEESASALERLHGSLPHTVESITGGGGRHVYFARPGGTVRSRAGLASGIDLRADGGLVVAPPSLHPSGRRYKWEVSHHLDDTPLAPMPEWLLERVWSEAGHLGHPPAHWRRLVREGVREGERNTTIASLTGHLLWHGVDPQVALEFLLSWNRVRCRPPLSDDEVAATVESITRTHVRHRRAERNDPQKESPQSSPSVEPELALPPQENEVG